MKKNRQSKLGKFKLNQYIEKKFSIKFSTINKFEKASGNNSILTISEVASIANFILDISEYHSGSNKNFSSKLITIINNELENSRTKLNKTYNFSSHISLGVL